MVLAEAGLGVRVLTKNPALALELDPDVLETYDVDFGVSLTFSRHFDRQLWEPNAGTVAERIFALRRAHELSIRTWASVEPVFSPDQALELIQECWEVVDVWRVGKLNHDAAREDAIDWEQFLWRVLNEFGRVGANYVIKEDLWAFADVGLRTLWPRRKGVAEE